MTKGGLAAWHAYMERGADPDQLAQLLADDVVFHSPVVHSPQVGKAKVMLYLLSAAQVLGNESFRYVREVAQGLDVLLEFECQLDGIHVNGIDLIRFNEAGQISDFKVMVRPLKAVNKVWDQMAAQLQAAGG